MDEYKYQRSKKNAQNNVLIAFIRMILIFVAATVAMAATTATTDDAKAAWLQFDRNQLIN